LTIILNLIFVMFSIKKQVQNISNRNFRKMIFSNI